MLNLELFQSKQLDKRSNKTIKKTKTKKIDMSIEKLESIILKKNLL
jgi:hypothetical protein